MEADLLQFCASHCRWRQHDKPPNYTLSPCYPVARKTRQTANWRFDARENEPCDNATRKSVTNQPSYSLNL
jgi:hypothetical protein